MTTGDGNDTRRPNPPLGLAKCGVLLTFDSELHAGRRRLASTAEDLIARRDRCPHSFTHVVCRPAREIQGAGQVACALMTLLEGV